MSSEQAGFTHHPVQLTGVFVKELHIELIDPRAVVDGHEIEEQNVKLFNGYSDYDADQKAFSAFMKVEIGMGDDKKDSPFRLRCEVAGQFEVDDEVFDVEKVAVWAKNAAPYIIYPYLREHVFGLSTRAGLQGVILPLLQLPTYK